jgi:hypothetical protein
MSVLLGNHETSADWALGYCTEAWKKAKRSSLMFVEGGKGSNSRASNKEVGPVIVDAGRAPILRDGRPMHEIRLKSARRVPYKCRDFEMKRFG